MTMNCRLFEVVIDDLVRDRCSDERTRQRAFEHLRACPACERRFKELRCLVVALDQLSAATTEKKAPQEVEDFLRLRFRQWKGDAPGRKARKWLWAAAAATLTAFVLGVSLFIAPGWLRVSSLPSPQRVPVVAGTRRTPAPTLAESANPPGWPEDFMPLPYGEDAGPMTEAQVVTVRLSAEDLQDIGLPTDELDRQGYVTAEIVIGEDGIARGIRFVQ